MTLERLHKTMASAGIGSRRECEGFIEAGRVSVDGAVVRELGTKVDPDACTIRFDDEPVKIPRRVYYMVNKPRGVISTCKDNLGRPSVIDLIPQSPIRLFPVGRLDADSVGLVLLTNDGGLAQKLTHPKFEVTKTYEARVKGYVSDEGLERLRKGVWMSDGRARVEGVRVKKRTKTTTHLTITLHEGKNREIRRIMAKVGHPVFDLRRLSIGTLKLANLKEGHHRKLTAEEIAELRRLARRSVKSSVRKGGRRPRSREAAVENPETKEKGRKETRKPRRPSRSGLPKTGDSRRRGPRKASRKSAPARKTTRPRVGGRRKSGPPRRSRSR